MRIIPRQPELIRFNERLYTRVSRFRHIGGENSPQCEGPFYARDGVDSNDWAYTPDSAYLWQGHDSDKEDGAPPSIMHCIQQRIGVDPESRPKD